MQWQRDATATGVLTREERLCDGPNVSVHISCVSECESGASRRHWGGLRRINWFLRNNTPIFSINHHLSVFFFKKKSHINGSSILSYYLFHFHKNEINKWFGIFSSILNCSGFFTLTFELLRCFCFLAEPTRHVGSFHEVHRTRFCRPPAQIRVFSQNDSSSSKSNELQEQVLLSSGTRGSRNDSLHLRCFECVFVFDSSGAEQKAM